MLRTKVPSTGPLCGLCSQVPRWRVDSGQHRGSFLNELTHCARAAPSFDDSGLVDRLLAQTQGSELGTGRPLSFRDLWERLIAETRRHDAQWVKVKGHSGHVMNDRVDALARGAIATLGPSARA